MTEPRFNLHEQARNIKALLLQGQVEYAEAKAMLKPIVAEAERRGAEIAKRFKKKPPKFSVTALLR